MLRAVLLLEDVRKSFYDPGRGEVRAVDGVSARIEEGVVALVGANGAGKSTLLRLVATLLRPDTGRVLVDGRDTRDDADAVRARLGYLSTTTRLYQQLSGLELLRYAGGFHAMAPAELERRITVQVAAFALEPFLHQRIKGLSTGQLQRINLARTLLAEPTLLILDEPTTGLDVLAARQVVEAVGAARRGGRTILLATHHLDEVEALADRLLVIHAGRLAYDGAPAGLGTGRDFAEAIHRLVSGAAA